MLASIFDFVQKMPPGDRIQVLLLVATAIGLFLTLSQMRANSRQKAAEYIIELYNQYYADSDITDIYYKIEYGDFNYHSQGFHRSDEERKLDKLLSLYDNIGKLYLLSNFTIKDLDHVAYQYLVVFQDNSVREYLDILDRWYSRKGMRIKPFASFRKVGEILEKKYFSVRPEGNKHRQN